MASDKTAFVIAGGGRGDARGLFRLPPRCHGCRATGPDRAHHSTPRCVSDRPRHARQPCAPRRVRHRDLGPSAPHRHASPGCEARASASPHPCRGDGYPHRRGSGDQRWPCGRGHRRELRHPRSLCLASIIFGRCVAHISITAFLAGLKETEVRAKARIFNRSVLLIEPAEAFIACATKEAS
jgi:hypothetical protein